MSYWSLLRNYRTGLSIPVMVLFVFCGCGDKNENNSIKHSHPKVVIQPVIKKTVPLYMDFSGTIQAVKTVNIIPRVSGYIDKRYFKEGGYVKKGAKLYLIDPRPFKARLDAEQATLKVDQTKLDFWNVEAARYKKLAVSGAVSQEKKESMITKKNSYEATVTKDKADVENAKLELSFTNITAPFTGRIQTTQFHEGNLVEKQKDVLTTLIQMDPIYVIFNLSRADAFHIQKLRRAGKLYPVEKMIVEIYLPDGSIYSQKGTINYISFLIDPTTDCIMARGVIHNTNVDDRDYDLIPGQYTPVRLTIGETPDALLVPKTAIVESQLGTHVYVVGNNNIVSERKVETGYTYGELIEIKKGVTAGEHVISQGTQKVKDKITVNPVSSKTKDSSSKGKKETRNPGGQLRKSE